VAGGESQMDRYYRLILVVMGFKAVHSFDTGKFDDIRIGISRWHRRQGLFRVAALLDRLTS